MGGAGESMRALVNLSFFPSPHVIQWIFFNLDWM